MDSEAAFKNIWIPRRKPEEKDDTTVGAAEELEQFRQIESQDDSGESDEAFASALKSVTGEEWNQLCCPVDIFLWLSIRRSKLKWS